MPIEDISARRTSTRWAREKGKLSSVYSEYTCQRLTSISFRLLPQQLRYLLRPGILDVLRHALQHPGVIRLALPEPNLKFGRRVTRVCGQTNVRGLDAVLVDVDVQILGRKQER